MHLPLPPSLPPSNPPPSILHSGCSPFVDASSHSLTEGCDVGTATGGHYNTAASRPDWDVIWGGGTCRERKVG